MKSTVPKAKGGMFQKVGGKPSRQHGHVIPSRRETEARGQVQGQLGNLARLCLRMGWECVCSSAIEHIPSMSKALHSIHSTQK